MYLSLFATISHSVLDNVRTYRGRGQRPVDQRHTFFLAVYLVGRHYNASRVEYSDS
jgi:hypothetical protein